ncbi:acetylglutamate kinase [Candidatus Woesearchaeota archaeon]|nr:acetylglutamate kinase [Candidatus Woesearchaeota archaeon]
MEEIQKKAGILAEVLQYVKTFRGKIVVVKFGGNAMVNDDCTKSIFTDISILKIMGLNVILVHGGGPELDREMIKANIPKKVINGLRVTDKKTLEIAKRVFRKINEVCVHHLKENGVKAKDCTESLIATKITDRKLGYVGDIVGINRPILLKAVRSGYIPVVSPLGKEKGIVTNINADTVATRIAQELKAEKLTIITNVRGVRIDGKFVSHLSTGNAKRYIESGEITSGMIPKVLACVDAVNHNVRKAHLINGDIKHALLLEIFTEKGIGTEIVK